jgi:hypothetical protein
MFFLKYDVSYYYNNMWNHYGRFESKDIKYFIIIQSRREMNTSRLTIFISRGLLPKDRQIGDFIVNHIKRWNIQLVL